MKTIFLAAALSIGMAGAALAGQASSIPSTSGTQVVMPNQRADYLDHYTLAESDFVLQSQRAEYLKHYNLAQDDVVMPNQRAGYLKHYELAGNSTVFPSQRPAYLA